MLELTELRNNIVVEYKRTNLGKYYLKNALHGDVLFFCTKYSQQKTKELNRMGYLQIWI